MIVVLFLPRPKDLIDLPVRAIDLKPFLDCAFWFFFSLSRLLSSLGLPKGKSPLSVHSVHSVLQVPCLPRATV